VDAARRQRTLRRYRFMFKATLAEVAVALLMLLMGVLVAVRTSETTLAGIAVLLFAAAVLNGYKILNSTVRLLEQEAREGRLN